MSSFWTSEMSALPMKGIIVSMFALTMRPGGANQAFANAFLIVFSVALDEMQSAVPLCRYGPSSIAAGQCTEAPKVQGYGVDTPQRVSSTGFWPDKSVGTETWPLPGRV